MISIPRRKNKVKRLQVIQGFNCAIANSLGIYADPHELHHAGIPDTKANRSSFPLLIHSLWNLRLVNHWLHLQNGSFGRISMKEARSRERFLNAHPCISKKLNCEV